MGCKRPERDCRYQNGEEVAGVPTLPFVGLNCGTANAVDTFANNEKFIRGYEKVVLGFDNDEATALEKERKVRKVRKLLMMLQRFC